ncbi:hydrogenase subunit MbhD domain-containing protein [Methylocystis echinoides]|uniref:Sodium:proton antiporter n=1 Tax=Methylocystis echinoides TaxID=29468 RepID=A0A9W6LTW9_9HYPH|nr:hydrogenase subunit MbhD domain-containing protein [Methylocystis echinoides]GLI95063.1 sodium:proton antiporter [Methylocystis echinoides]
MTLAAILDASFAALTLLVATYAIFARGLFAAVVAFISYGLLLALVWVRLSAVDVALTEAAIGSGVTGALLIGAAARIGDADGARAGQPKAMTKIIAALLCVAVTAGIAAAVLSLPTPAPTLAPRAVRELPATGLGNPVTGVLLAYRAIDTLLESVVLVFALIGIWSFSRDGAWGGAPRSPDAGTSDSALTFLGQLLPPIAIIVGVHLVWTGADAPGGAFQGGTVLAAAWILVMIAGLRQPPRIDGGWLRFALVVGPALFLAIGLIGYGIAGAFLAYPEGFAKPLILLIEAALTLSIAVALGLLALGAPARRHQP